jgi:hypothetical protein
MKANKAIKVVPGRWPSTRCYFDWAKRAPLNKALYIMDQTMEQELTKSGKPVSAKTFGSMICIDKACRHSAVELELFDSDLRLFGRYLHFNGHRTLREARGILERFVKNKIDPFVGLKPKVGKVVDFQAWKNNR